MENPGEIIEESLLAGPVPDTAKPHMIDFAKSPAPEFTGYFAMVVSDVLTPEECSALISLVQPADDAPWPRATVGAYSGAQIYDPLTRHCGRIIHTSPKLAERLFERIRPFIPGPVATLYNAPGITGQFPVIRTETWCVSGCNEALKFLRYDEGDFFAPHCDGNFEKDDKMSYLTAHFYLNGGGDGDGADGEIEGGATRFSMDTTDPRAGRVDVNPQRGSVLIFQQRDMYHEGVEVTKGVKYTLRTDVMFEKV